MAAFRLAIDEGYSDWIELDVHQTRDGQIVVSHDDHITKDPAHDLFVHDATYDEVMQVDVGAWMSPMFANTRTSTLAEVLDAADYRSGLARFLRMAEETPNFLQALGL